MTQGVTIIFSGHVHHMNGFYMQLQETYTNLAYICNILYEIMIITNQEANSSRTNKTGNECLM